MPGSYYPIKAFCPTEESVTLELPSEIAADAIKRGPQKRYYELCGDESPDATGSCVQEVLGEPSSV